MKNGEQPAYPNRNLIPASKNGYGEIMEYRLESTGGLNKREIFAMAAMQGILASGGTPTNQQEKDSDPRWVAEASIKCAEELLKQLETK